MAIQSGMENTDKKVGNSKGNRNHFLEGKQKRRKESAHKKHVLCKPSIIEDSIATQHSSCIHIVM